MIIIKKNQVAEQLFFISLFIFNFISLLSTSFFYIDIIGSFYNLTLALCVFLLFLKEILKRCFSIKEITFFLVCCLLFVLMYQASKMSIAAYILFIFSARDIDLKATLKVVAISNCLGMLFVIGSSLLGIIPNYNVLGRQYLGFRYALFAPAIMINVTSIAIYLLKGKIKWSIIFLLFLLNYVLFLATAAKLSFIAALVLISISLFVKIKRKHLLPNKFLYPLNLSFIFSSVVSIIITIKYSFDKPWMYNLNRALEYRLSLANSSYQSFGINLFGSNVNWNGSGLDIYGQYQASQYMYVDNFYINVIQLYGIIFFTVLIVLLTLTLYKSFWKGDFLLLIILSIFAFHGLIDDLMFTSYYNAFFLAMGPYLLHSSSLERKIKAHRTTAVKN